MWLSSEVGRIKERSDAAPATARGMHMDQLSKLRFAWSGLRCLFLLRWLAAVVSVDAARSPPGQAGAYEQVKEVK